MLYTARDTQALMCARAVDVDLQIRSFTYVIIVSTYAVSVVRVRKKRTLKISTTSFFLIEIVLTTHEILQSYLSGYLLCFTYLSSIQSTAKLASLSSPPLRPVLKHQIDSCPRPQVIRNPF